MELLIPDEMSPISFRSSCLDSFFPERTNNISGLKILLQLLSIIESSTNKVYVCSEGLTLQVWTKYLFNSNHYSFAYILCLLPASVSLPPEDTSGGFWGSGFWGWWRRHCQPEYRCTRTSPLVQTSGWDAWSQGSLQNKKWKTCRSKLKAQCLLEQQGKKDLSENSFTGFLYAVGFFKRNDSALLWKLLISKTVLA